ncbi:MAG: (Fe-S)-binding protein [Candidatus Tectomicrobia bacterium]|nr:(Fe-S)-binding protein [Candidatus Tectomicrobia bacterium]
MGPLTPGGERADLPDAAASTTAPGEANGSGIDLALPCIHCGLCLDHCPTYRALGRETDSPRGRIYLIRAQAEGRIGLTDNYIKHLDLCLNCRACETACPSGVRFGALMESARERLYRAAPQRYQQGSQGELLLRHLIARPALLRAAFALLRWARPLLLGPARALLSPEQRNFAAMLPPTAGGSFSLRAKPVYRARHERRATVALLTGCVMDVLFDDVHEATVGVLRANGCDVLVPRPQSCCGALHAHAGRGEEARAMARRVIDQLGELACDAVLVNAAGCGAHLKSYGRLLAADAAYAERARAFAAKVRDVSEFLAALELKRPPKAVAARVAYDDPCHLLHGQQISRQPRELLRLIQGVELVDFPEADACCGSAGIYTLAHADLSLQILDRKMAHIAAAAPDIIASGNPGCLLQLRLGVARAGLTCRVVHPITLLAEAYGA